MTVYVSEVPSDVASQYDRDMLHIVRNGVDVRLPLDADDQQVTVADDHPDWVAPFVQTRGYTPIDGDSDSAQSLTDQPVNG